MAVEVDTGPDEQQGQEQQEGGLQCASSSGTPPARQRMRLVAGAIALALLLLILIPTIIPLMLAWCVVEVLFFMLKSRPEAASLDAQPQPHWPDAAAKHDLSAFNRFLRYSKEAPGGVNYTKYLSGWFLGADVASIRRENVEEFVSYGFCYKSRCVCVCVASVQVCISGAAAARVLGEAQGAGCGMHAAVGARTPPPVLAALCGTCREQLAAEGKGDLAKRMTDQLEQIWDIESPPGGCIICLFAEGTSPS